MREVGVRVSGAARLRGQRLLAARLLAAGLLVAGLVAGGCAARRPAVREDPVPSAGAPHAELSLAEEAGRGPAEESDGAPARPTRHRVEAGQTVYRISRMYGCEVAELMAANRLEDPRTLRAGQVLRLPACSGAPDASLLAARTASVGKASAQGTAASPGREEASNRASSTFAPRTRGRLVVTGRDRTVEASTRGTLDWPLRGVLYGRFGKKGREPHDGIDLAAPEGTPVRTAAAGTVLYAGEQRGYGNIVLVEHTEGLITLYAHNRDVRVRTGQTVKEGQVVATVGASGQTSGPHLHFEVRREGMAVDPLLFLGAPPAREP